MPKTRKQLLSPELIERIKNNQKLSAQEKKLVREMFEAQVLTDTRKVTVLQYRYMKLTEDWGDIGEQRVSISYCRHLLNIPNDREVTQLDADRFAREFEKLCEPYKNLSPSELRVEDEKVRCNLFFKEVDYSREKEINLLLMFLGSDKGYISGQLGIFRSIIYGPAEKQEIDGYRITTFQKEEARTPAAVLSIAAVVGGKHIAIRMGSCETIYANKWAGFFKLRQEELFFDLLDHYENVGIAFKCRALLAYQAGSLPALKPKKKLFIKEMVEGLFWHEMGHGIVINDLLTVEDSAFGEALGVLGANVIAVMKEILADWAPIHGKLLGPLRYMCKIAQKERTKASRMLKVYFSDNWFLGNQDDSFDNHSEIMLSLIFKFVKKDGSIDFKALSKELDSKELANRAEGIFYYVLEEYKRITKYLEAQLKSSVYQQEGNSLNFDRISAIYTQKVREIEKELEESSIEFMVMFWAKILEDLPKMNQHLFTEIENYLESENKKFHRYILEEFYQISDPKIIEEGLNKFLMSELKQKGYYFVADENFADKSAADLLKYFSGK